MSTWRESIEDVPARTIALMPRAVRRSKPVPGFNMPDDPLAIFHQEDDTLTRFKLTSDDQKYVASLCRV